MKISYIVLLSVIFSVSFTPAFAEIYENVTVQVDVSACNYYNAQQCIDFIMKSWKSDNHRIDDAQKEASVHATNAHSANKGLDIMTEKFNVLQDKFNVLQSEQYEKDYCNAIESDYADLSSKLSLAEEKINGYEDAIEYTHVETRQKLDACEVDLLNLINDEVTYVQHEDILHKFNKTATSTNSTLLTNENNLLKKELSSMKLYVTAQNELMLEVIRIFNSNQTVN